MVPALGVHFVGRTPRVRVGRMEAEFVLTRPVATITCQLYGGSHANNAEDRDCEGGGGRGGCDQRFQVGTERGPE